MATGPRSSRTRSWSSSRARRARGPRRERQAVAEMASPLQSARRVVVKIGSSLLTNAGAGLDRDAIADWTKQIAALRSRGIEVLVVSSGAIAEGMKRLGWSRRPHAVNEL